MLQDIDSLRKRLEDLRSSSNSLADFMLDAAGELRGSGVPPTLELMERLTGLLAEFDGLCCAVLDAPSTKAGQVGSFSELNRALLDAESREKARGVLERVLLIQHRGDGDFEPLKDVHAVTRSLIEKLEAAKTLPEIERLISGNHSCNALLLMIESSDDVADEDWTVANDRITDEFGRAIATAAARGRLVIPAQD